MPDPLPHLVATPCRTTGCRHTEVRLGLCFRCLGRYRGDGARRGERVEEVALELRGTVDDRLLGFSGEFRHAMAINLAAHLVAVEHPLADTPGLWWRALTDTLADAIAEGVA